MVNFIGFLAASSPPLDAPGNSLLRPEKGQILWRFPRRQTLTRISATLQAALWWHLNPRRDICVSGGCCSRKQQTKEKTRNEKLLSLYMTLPNTYFYSIIALPFCIFFFFKSMFNKTLMWAGFFFCCFLLWKPILLSMENRSFNSSPVCSEIVSFIFGIRRKTILKSKFTPIKLNLIEKRQRHSLTS